MSASRIPDPVASKLAPSAKAVRLKPVVAPPSNAVLSEDAFQNMIATERKRTERSHVPFLVILVDINGPRPLRKQDPELTSIVKALAGVTRETDTIGWYTTGKTLGLMYTELTSVAKSSESCDTADKILARVQEKLVEELGSARVALMKFTLHRYPDHWDYEAACSPVLYPDFSQSLPSRPVSYALKRLMDIAGSIFILILVAPLFILCAIAIKLTSPGPVFFRQQRVGQFGKVFTFLKFRSMNVNNDETIHKQWFNNFVSGQGGVYKSEKTGQTSFKMTNDPRITAIGKILRRTSMDELPQFINVLKGEMSLVGPRPPIPYEVDAYKTWHRSRLLSCRPGITGLWQVSGRSRVAFDEMVRLDLRYASTWSLWLDIKILLRTPKAVVSGSGAF